MGMVHILRGKGLYRVVTLATAIWYLHFLCACAQGPAGGLAVREIVRDRWMGQGLLAVEVVADTAWLHVLRQESLAWLGTPYLWGAEGPDSIDCSGFVRAVYMRAAGLALPRRASWQAMLGVPVGEGQLRAGDLVFFGNPTGEVDHVGIYWDAGWFINATVSRGVAFSHLSEPFWSGRYLGAKRLAHALGKW